MASLSHVIAQNPKAAAKAVRGLGKKGDTILAHINPREARLLDLLADDKIDHPVNRSTGLPTFGDGDGTGTSGGGGGEGGDNGVGGPGNGSAGTGPGQGESTSSGTADTGGFGFGGGGFGFGGSTGQFSDNYGGLAGFGFGGTGVSPAGPTSMDQAQGFGMQDSNTIGAGGDMSNFASPVGSLTSTFSDPAGMDQPAPAKPYDPLSSPVKEAPQRPDVRKAVDNFNNTVGKVTSLRQEVGVNPTTKVNEPHNYLDINPVSLGLGFVTGMPIGHLMDLADIKDPYGFSVDMGYGANASTNPDRDGDGYSDSAGDSSDQDRRLGEGLKSFMSPPAPAPALTNPGTLTPVTPSTPGSSYVPPTSPLSSVTPVGQTKLRARRGLMGDYAPNFRTSAV